MNKKGTFRDSIYLMAIIIVVLLLAAIVGWWAITKTSEAGISIAEFGECERGIGGMYGMCSPIQCEAVGGDSVISTLKACPSTRLKSALQLQKIPKKEINKYKYCCIVDKCSDMTDKGINRIPACFYEDTSLCATEKGHKTNYEEKHCLGYAKDCLPGDGCCCVIPGSNQ